MTLSANSIDRLKSQLLTSNLQQKNQPLFQIINLLIDAVRQSLATGEALTSGSTSGGSVLGQSFLTLNNDQTTLANSRRLEAGAGISFNMDGERLLISAAIPISIAEDGEDGLQGPPGIQGPTGVAGQSALTFPYSLNDSNEEPPEAIIVQNIVANDGLWQSVPFNAADYTASGGMTWTVAAVDVTFNKVMVSKKTIIWGIAINATSILGGAADIFVFINAPLGYRFRNVGQNVKPSYCATGGAVIQDAVVQSNTATQLVVHRGGAAFALGSFALYFTIILELE